MALGGQDVSMRALDLANEAVSSQESDLPADLGREPGHDLARQGRDLRAEPAMALESSGCARVPGRADGASPGPGEVASADARENADTRAGGE
jgi:hypothetical protein